MSRCGRRRTSRSVPRIFVWFLPRYGRYTKAVILHDYLWRVRAKNGTLDYVDADGIFRRAMRELGVPFMKRWIMWAAVRWGALFKPGGRKGWLRESPRVVLVTRWPCPSWFRRRSWWAQPSASSTWSNWPSGCRSRWSNG